MEAQQHKSFTLKFLHVNARVTVIKQPEGYLAFIVFPKAYVFTGEGFYHALPAMIAGSMDYACEMAATQFKVFYSALDRKIRLVGDFNFFIERLRYRTSIERSVGSFKAQFVVTRTLYGIMENVDGQKWAKSTLALREDTLSYKVLFWINFKEVFEPIQLLGFNGKFIQRLMFKHDKVKANRLRVYDNGTFVDDLLNNPGRLVNHVADNREDFLIALGWEKAKRMMGRGL